MSYFKNIAIFEKYEQLFSTLADATTTVPYSGDGSINFASGTVKSEIRVTAEDTISAALRIKTETPECKLAVLNFASALHPGGGYAQGAMAQEECLCRCSDLYRALVKQPL